MRLEREEGRTPTLVALAADSFPAPDPAGTVVAVSLGHLGWRTDWALAARRSAERLRASSCCCSSARGTTTSAGGPRLRACRERAEPRLARRSAATSEAARLILCADVGIVPFKVEPFNDAGLPYRILKYARLGRRTVAPPLAGGRAPGREAVTTAGGPAAWVAALRGRGRRAGATRTLELREWALARPRGPERAAVGSAARARDRRAVDPDTPAYALKRARARDRGEAGVGHVGRRARAVGEAVAAQRLAPELKKRDAAVAAPRAARADALRGRSSIQRVSGTRR